MDCKSAKSYVEIEKLQIAISNFKFGLYNEIQRSK